MDPVISGLIGFVILLLLSALISATHAASANARRQTLRDRAEQGDGRARRALVLAEDSTRLLSTFQVARLGVYFLTAGLVTVFFAIPLADVLSRSMPSIGPAAGYGLSYLIITFFAVPLIFLMGELLPEALAQRQAEDWAIALSGPTRLVVGALAPLAQLMLWLSRVLMAPLGGPPDQPYVTEEEIMTLVDAGEEEGAIDEDEKEMIYSIFQLDETLAREIMVPRIDIVALEMGIPLAEARQVVIDAGHSRIPVYEGSLDHIKGLLYAKDLLNVWHNGENELDFNTMLRPALFVPESKRVSDLLRELQAAKVHLAIVVDEYGGTAGLVTIEDIVEEIVGEILDEYDTAEETLLERLDDDEFIFDARVDLDDFNRLLDARLSDELGDTLGGFIYGQLGKVPEPGEQVETNYLLLEVLSVSDRRIGKVRVKRLHQDETSSNIKNGKNHAQNGNEQ